MPRAGLCWESRAEGRPEEQGFQQSWLETLVLPKVCRQVHQRDGDAQSDGTGCFQRARRVKWGATGRRKSARRKEREKLCGKSKL